MKVGITILSGLVGEYVGWEPTRAWDRAVEMGRVAERLGFSYAWVPDHLQVVRGPADGPTFEAFTLLSAIAAETHRIRLGPGVACAAFRNPALLVKMAMTLDVASNGRVDLAMGAGWHEGEIGRLVTSITTVSRTGHIEEIAASPETFAYRSSPGLGDRFAASVTLKLLADDPARIEERMRGYRDHRVGTQPTGARNAGCIFKNPPGDHAGRLIEACGLKGRASGRAAVSDIHANFIINKGGATYEEIATLIEDVRESVLKQTGVELEQEVRSWR